VKLLVDMSLSPSWVDRLARSAFEVVHWSTIGAATATESEILTWASDHGFVVITNDLDFSAILAASAQATPRELKGNLAAMLGSAQNAKRSPETGDLSRHSLRCA
jgi:predicted nuclease of predicted toxin-antitoxin system